MNQQEHNNPHNEHTKRNDQLSVNAKAWLVLQLFNTTNALEFDALPSLW